MRSRNGNQRRIRIMALTCTDPLKPENTIRSVYHVAVTASSSASWLAFAYGA